VLRETTFRTNMDTDANKENRQQIKEMEASERKRSDLTIQELKLKLADNDFKMLKNLESTRLSAGDVFEKSQRDDKRINKQQLDNKVDSKDTDLALTIRSLMEEQDGGNAQAPHSFQKESNIELENVMSNKALDALVDDTMDSPSRGGLSNTVLDHDDKVSPTFEQVIELSVSSAYSFHTARSSSVQTGSISEMVGDMYEINSTVGSSSDVNEEEEENEFEPNFFHQEPLDKNESIQPSLASTTSESESTVHASNVARTINDNEKPTDEGEDNSCTPLRSNVQKDINDSDFIKSSKYKFAQAITDIEEKLIRRTFERDSLKEKVQELTLQNVESMSAIKISMEAKMQQHLDQYKLNLHEKETEWSNRMEFERAATLKKKEEFILRISNLEKQVVNLNKQHSSQIQKLQNEHNAELEEIIKQLDMVEDEHLQKVIDMQRRLEEKDTVVSAVTNQLMEARSTSQQLEHDKVQLEERVASLETETTTLREKNQSLTQLLEYTKLEHKQAMEQELLYRQVAVREAEEDIRSAAEEQFNEANRHYLKLKNDYKAIKEQLRVVQEEANLAHDDSKAKEVKWLGEVSKVKAALATAESSLAQSTENYLRELEELRRSERALRTKLAEEQKSSASAHKTAALLAQENEELKSVSEELMALLEANQLG